MRGDGHAKGQRAVALLALACALTQARPAQAADIGQISKLQDVSFSNLDPLASVSNSQNLCVFSSALTALYTITASGSGAGGAFTLTAGGAIPPLPYSVLWSPTSGQTNGTALTPGLPVPNMSTSALSLLCLTGLGTSASLTVVLAASDLQQATSGVSYTGQLTLTVTAQ